MKVYECIFCHKEVLCDNDRPLQEVGPMYRVVGKMIEVGNEDFGISANVDEDAGEGATAEGDEKKAKKVLDIVHHNNLVKYEHFDKAGYMAYLKGYLKNLIEAKIKDAEKVKEFQGQVSAFIKAKVNPNFDEVEFFYPDMGDDVDYDNAICILHVWEDDGTTPVFYYFKLGLEGHKV